MMPGMVGGGCDGGANAMGKMASGIMGGQEHQDMQQMGGGMVGFDEAALGPQGQMGMMQGADPAFMEAWGQAGIGGMEQQAMMGGPAGAQFADDQYQAMAAQQQAGGWADEFGAQAMGGPMQPNPMQQQWANEFGDQMGMPQMQAMGIPQGPMQMGYGMHMQGPPMMGMQQMMPGPMGPMMGQQYQHQQPMHQQPAEEWQEGDTAAEEWADELEGQEEEQKALPNERDLDEASTRQLTAQVVRSLNNDPKMRGSQFVDFIAKMSTGEIEFQDGEVVYNDGPQALPGAVHPSELQGGDWAAEFASLQDQHDVEDWAEEHADQQWQQQLQTQPGMPMGGMMGGMTAPAQVANNAWANELAAQESAPLQEDLANEYTDGDALGLNPNPLTGEASLKHKFTLPNPYGDDQTPYETGMELYRSGDYSNAILAFEAELQRNADNGDAKFQLASAIILGST